MTTSSPAYCQGDLQPRLPSGHLKPRSFQAQSYPAQHTIKVTSNWVCHQGHSKPSPYQQGHLQHSLYCQRHLQPNCLRRSPQAQSTTLMLYQTQSIPSRSRQAQSITLKSSQAQSMPSKSPQAQSLPTMSSSAQPTAKVHQPSLPPRPHQSQPIDMYCDSVNTFSSKKMTTLFKGKIYAGNNTAECAKSQKQYNNKIKIFLNTHGWRLED